jgi:hypothetical protein
MKNEKSKIEKLIKIFLKIPNIEKMKNPKLKN